MKNRIILTMKWGTLYPAEYVNVLYNACKANITGDFQFVCLTNEADGLNPNIIVHPIPEFGLSEYDYYHGAWPKLGVFQENLYNLKGRALFVDLDTVINNNIDSFFEQEGDFIAINSHNWEKGKKSNQTMSGIFSFDIGSLGYVLTKFIVDKDNYIKQFIIEQDYLNYIIDNKDYWPKGTIVSFKYDLRQPLILDRFKPPAQPPASAKILVFHGKPRPTDLVYPTHKNWDVFPHYGKGAVDWMQRYWARYNHTD